ncbi:MAG: hypothetical protein EYC70_07095 [Planctomycetota bacterium]|nr:MAG: hypothetical protein EYC70_07095 [Planctomycetota bacterium]
MSKKTSKKEPAGEAALASEPKASPPQELAATEPAATSRKRKTKEADPAPPAPTVPPSATLQDISKGYLGSLEEAGGSESTLFGYRMELKRAMAVLGADTNLSDLSPEVVAAYFTSDRVTKSRAGKRLAPRSVAKTKRVFRLALVWAGAAALVPEEEQPKRKRAAEPVAA